MTNEKREALRNELIFTVGKYNPEYFDTCDEAEVYLKGLLDSIQRFNDECMDYAMNEKEKHDAC